MESVQVGSNDRSNGIARAEHVSALVDGEALGDERAIEALIQGFDGQARSIWADYHLICDALSSDELAARACASAAFLERFSARLASEPHLLAPSALAAPRGGQRRWLARRRLLPAFAVAAAAATLTWVVVPQLQSLGVGRAGALVAGAGLAGSAAANGGAHGTVQRVAMASLPAVARAPEAGATVLHDARLDEYLEAHQQFAQQPIAPSSMPLVRAVATSEGR